MLAHIRHLKKLPSICGVINRLEKRSVASSSKLPILTLYTKEECTLCDEAKEVLTPAWHKFDFEEVDITLPENKEWYRKYRYDIPVFHLNGEYLMKHRADLQLLEQKLDQLQPKHSKH